MWRKSAPLTTMLLHTFWIGDKVCNISRNLWMDLDGCNAFSGAIQNNEKCNNITLEYFNLISYHRQQDLNGNPAAAKAACHFAFGIWPNCLCKTRSLQGNLPTFPNVFLHDKDLSWPQGCNSNGFLRGVWVNFDHLCIDELRQLGQAFHQPLQILWNSECGDEQAEESQPSRYLPGSSRLSFADPISRPQRMQGFNLNFIFQYDSMTQHGAVQVTVFWARMLPSAAKSCHKFVVSFEDWSQPADIQSFLKELRRSTVYIRPRSPACISFMYFSIPSRASWSNCIRSDSVSSEQQTASVPYSHGKKLS